VVKKIKNMAGWAYLNPDKPCLSERKLFAFFKTLEK
jgi:hypothetical protein